MAYCNDCGLQAVSNGICSNCQEELYIIEFQSEWIDELSDEFVETANQQRTYLRERKLNDRKRAAARGRNEQDY